MTLTDHYFEYLQRLNEGTMLPPQGLCLTEQEPLRRAAQLQQQVQEMGIPAFVRLCAQAEGRQIAPELYAQFRPEEVAEALSALLADHGEPGESALTEQEPDPAQPPQIQEPDGPRSAYEVLLDCCCLDENLLFYLIDVLKRREETEFQKLALVTARKAFTMKDFLYWFSTKQDRASREELICVTLMDACFDRLAAQGETELIAALISGDQRTFELFRCEAPELQQLPDATYPWYEAHYLQNYYPIRYMLKFNGISV